MIKWLISLFRTGEVKTSPKYKIINRDKAILKVAVKHFEASKKLKI